MNRPALAHWRAQTPGLQHVCHFNHAGSSLMPQPVLDVLQAQWQREAERGGMEAAASVASAVDAAYQDAARLLGAQPDEVAFSTGAGAAWGRLVASIRWQAGDRILIGRQEWASNLALLQDLSQRHGLSLEVLPCRDDGSVDPDALSAVLDDRVRLVSLTWLPANGGLINPAAEIGQRLRGSRALYLIDAAQAVGQLPVDVNELQCDLLVAAGRKYLRGPRGSGLLYVRRERLAELTPPYGNVHTQPWREGRFDWIDSARRFEDAELAPAIKLALGEAIRYALDIGLDTIRQCIDQQAQALRQRLATLPGVTVHDLGLQRSGLVSFTVDSLPASVLQQRLRQQGIHIGANGVAYTPLDMQARGLHELARASVSYYSNDEEQHQLYHAIHALIPQGEYL